MNMDQSALFGSLFLTGLAGSLHCIGMCGPILLAFSQALSAGGARPGFWRPDFFYYHAGRLWTYGLLGFLAGWAGFELREGSAYLGWQQVFSVVLAGLVIVSGVAALGVIPGLRLDLSLPGCGMADTRAGRPQGWLSTLLREPRHVARLLLGAVMGFLPCGLVYAMLLVVASLPSPLHSALGMVCFGAGTLPALTAVVLGSRAAPRWLRAHGTRIAAVLLIVMGLFMLARALLVSPSAHAHGGH